MANLRVYSVKTHITVATFGLRRVVRICGLMHVGCLSDTTHVLPSQSLILCASEVSALCGRVVGGASYSTTKKQGFGGALVSSWHTLRGVNT